MKILTLTTDYYGFGGMEASTREIDSELRIRSIDNLVISILDKRSDFHEYDTTHVTTLGEKDRRCYINPLTTLRLAQLVLNELKSRDILHINSKFPTLPLVTLCARLMNKKVVYTDHGRPAERSRCMETIYNITTRLNSFLSNISLGISRHTTKQLGRKGQNMGYFVDVDFFSQEVTSFKFDWPRRYIFYPARYCYGKNQAALLTAASDLSREGISIVLMGQTDDRSYYDGLVRCIEEEALTNVFIYPGQNREIIREGYSKADAVVFPSRGEGFGKIVIEANCQGTPAVLARTFGLVDTTIEGVNGCFYTLDDKADMLRALARARHITRDSCREHAACFSLRNYTDRLIELYSKLYSK